MDFYVEGDLMLYLTLKWVHLISLISWMAGILYLFRLFVYHREQGVTEPKIHTLFSTMESRLYRIIVMPGMGFTWIAGMSLLFLQPTFLKSGWLHGKFLLVILLTASSLYAGRLKRTLEAGHFEGVPSGKSLRLINEIPAILMIAIIALVVFKP